MDTLDLTEMCSLAFRPAALGLVQKYEIWWFWELGRGKNDISHQFFNENVNIAWSSSLPTAIPLCNMSSNSRKLIVSQADLG